MSFADLKVNRTQRKSKSFVTPSKTKSGGDDKSSRYTFGDTHVEVDGDAHAIRSEKTEATPLDGLYAALGPSLEVRRSAERGRGVWTKHHVHKGNVLVSLNPHVAVLSTRYLQSHCSSCCSPAPAAGLKKCTRCRVIFYCNTTCQTNDWALHKHECSALQRWAAAAPSVDVAIPSEAVRGLGRIIWGKQKQGIQSTWAKEIDLMHSHRSSLPASSFESHTHLAHSLVRYLDASSPADLVTFGLSSPGEIVDLISRFTTNTFTLSSPSLEPLGIAISPLVALFNHSCDPSAVLVFPRTSLDLSKEPVMHVVAIRDIPPGEEVLTAYIDTTFPRAIRQKELSESYNFTCSCSLCSADDRLDPRQAMWCPKLCGGTCKVPLDDTDISRCEQCKAIVSSPDTVLDAVRLGQEALDKATALQFKDPAKSAHLTSHILPLLTVSGLLPSAHPYLALTRLHLSLLLSVMPTSPTKEVLDSTIRTAAASSGGLENILPHGHPVRAIALTELGKLLAVDEPSDPSATSPSSEEGVSHASFPPGGPSRLHLAYTTLVRAYSELCVGFGSTNSGGEVGRGIREMIVELEKEIGVWRAGVKNVLNTSTTS